MTAEPSTIPETTPVAETVATAPAAQAEALPHIMDATMVAGSYLPILVFLVIAGGMAFVMTLLPLFVAKQKPDTEKLSSYECGFNAYGDTRTQFDVRFYLVAILFIIFDLEVAFLFPWVVALDDIGLFGFWSMMVFLGVLTIGFIYEWKKGALDWE